MKEMFRMVDKSKVDEVKQMLEYTQKGTAKATVGNYMVVLRNDPLVRESMKYNKLTGRIDIVKKLWWNEEVCKLDDDGRTYFYYFFERYQLFTESVADEVLLSMDNKDETVVDKILKQFDLLEYKDRHPLSLSGGQKQRVAIASAIVSNREIIVFDEPTSGLDLKHMREVARSLKSLADQGKTLLVITHDPELVMAGCSYVVHMEKGQVKESYPLDESGSKKVLDFFRIRQ